MVGSTSIEEKATFSWGNFLVISYYFFQSRLFYLFVILCHFFCVHFSSFHEVDYFACFAQVTLLDFLIFPYSVANMKLVVLVKAGGGKLWEPVCLCLPSSKVIDMCHLTWLLCGCGDQTQVLVLGQALYPLISLSIPTLIFQLSFLFIHR